MKNSYVFREDASDEHEPKQDVKLDVKLQKHNSERFKTIGYTLSWKDIVYKVEGKKNWKSLFYKEKGTMKTVLHSISGYVQPGTLMAIMGPSGGGKSTLLDVLSNRITKNLTGDLLLNGAPIPAAYKRICSYVPQESALHGSLTVRENLFYSAELRLPKKISREEKSKLIDDVISILGLTHVAKSMVGNPFIRGISGGEKTRASIGLELVVQPGLIFLDEPTSGLDSLSAEKVIDILKNLARESNITIVASIHQPSTNLFNKFDRLTLLSKGETVFHGLVQDAPNYFAKTGHPLAPYTNPADFYLDLINYDFDTEERKETARNMIEYYKASEEKKVTLKEIDQIIEHHQKIEFPDIKSFATGFFYQTWVLLRRTLLLYIKNPAIVWTRLIMYSILALMMGTLYWDIPNDQSSLQDRISVLFFSTAFLCFMSIAAFPAFIEDRLLFLRERRNGWFRVLPYVLAHTLVQIPFVFAIAISFSVISYFLIGLNESSSRFGYFVLMLWISLFTSESLVIMISAIVPYYIIGIAIGAMLYGAFMLVGGYFLRKSNIPRGWIWMHWLSFEKYNFEGMMVNEFKGEEFPCIGVFPNCSCFFPDLNQDCILTGEEILKEFDYDGVNKYNWLIVVLAFGLGFRIIFYLLLRFCNKGKR